MHYSVFISLFIIPAYAKVTLKPPKAIDRSGTFQQFTTEYSRKSNNDDIQQYFLEKTIEVTRKYRMYSEISDKSAHVADSSMRRKVLKDKQLHNHMQDNNNMQEIDASYLGYY